jgi:hypothetical protein
MIVPSGFDLRKDLDVRIENRRVNGLARNCPSAPLVSLCEERRLFNKTT